MSLANTGMFLGAADMRRLLSDPNLNVLSEHSTAANPNADGIGVMPDLRAIARHQGWARIVSPAAIANDADMMQIVTIDDFDRPFGKQWQKPIGIWSGPLARGQFRTPPEHIALINTAATGPDRIITHALSVGMDSGIRYLWWDTLGQNGGDWVAKLTTPSLSKSEPLTAAIAFQDRVDVVAISNDGHLVATRAEFDTHPKDFGPIEQLNAAVSFSGSAGPVMVSRLPGYLDVIAVSSEGQLRWGSVHPTSAGGWDVLEPIGGVTTTLARAVQPALAGRAMLLDVVAVGVDGLLYTVTNVDPFTLGWGDLRQIGGSRLLATEGSVALVARDLLHLDAFAIDVDGRLCWTTRNFPLYDWTELDEIGGSGFKLTPLGGVTAISRSADSLDVFVVATDGTLLWTQWTETQDWTDLRPI
jgi:hypothetical protein